MHRAAAPSPRQQTVLESVTVGLGDCLVLWFNTLLGRKAEWNGWEEMFDGLEWNSGGKIPSKGVTLTKSPGFSASVFSSRKRGWLLPSRVPERVGVNKIMLPLCSSATSGSWHNMWNIEAESVCPANQKKSEDFFQAHVGNWIQKLSNKLVI